MAAEGRAQLLNRFGKATFAVMNKFPICNRLLREFNNDTWYGSTKTTQVWNGRILRFRIWSVDIMGCTLLHWISQKAMHMSHSNHSVTLLSILQVYPNNASDRTLGKATCAVHLNPLQSLSKASSALLMGWWDVRRLISSCSTPARQIPRPCYCHCRLILAHKAPFSAGMRCTGLSIS